MLVQPIIELRLVVRKARPPDFGNFEFSQVAVTPENNNKTTYGERISGLIFTLISNPVSNLYVFASETIETVKIGDFSTNQEFSDFDKFRLF